MQKRRDYKRQVREKSLELALNQVKDLLNNSQVHHDLEEKHVSAIDWDSIPASLDPLSEITNMTKKVRAQRKRQQLQSIVQIIAGILKPGDKIVDFGSGSGYLGLLLSYVFPSSRIILIEHNPEKIFLAQKRMQNMQAHGCRNIYNRVELLNDINRLGGRAFDIGVGLHCCGALSDEVLDRCRNTLASFVLSPCCYGQIAIRMESHLGYLHSFDKHLNSGQFLTSWKSIAQAADFQCGKADNFDPMGAAFLRAKMCMNLVDIGLRLMRFSGQGPYDYKVSLHSMTPLSSSPKNNILVGVVNIRADMEKYMPIAMDESGNRGNPLNSFSSKVSQVTSLFRDIIQPHVLNSLTLIETPTPFYRLRCRFGLSKDASGKYSHFVYVKGVAQNITGFPIASQSISLLMPKVLEALRTCPLVNNGVEAVHYLTTIRGDMCVTLLYSVLLDSAVWEPAAREFKAKLEDTSSFAIKLIGRAKNIRIDVNLRTDNMSVKERLCLKDGRIADYLQCDYSFSNPNGRVNELVLDWLASQIKTLYYSGISQDPDPKCNLLELYCGNGNHTVTLASVFNRVCAVELDKKLVKLANANLELNKIKNVRVMQIHSERFWGKFTSLKKGVAQFDGDNFSTVLVDPPRAGLDAKTLTGIAAFEHILYISCMPTSLKRDLEILQRTHECVAFGIFDQFAFTPHIECGVVLQKKETRPH